MFSFDLIFFLFSFPQPKSISQYLSLYLGLFAWIFFVLVTPSTILKQFTFPWMFQWERKGRHSRRWSVRKCRMWRDWNNVCLWSSLLSSLPRRFGRKRICRITSSIESFWIMLMSRGYQGLYLIRYTILEKARIESREGEYGRKERRKVLMNIQLIARDKEFPSNSKMGDIFLRYTLSFSYSCLYNIYPHPPSLYFPP